LLSANPNLSPSDVKDILVSTATTFSSGTTNAGAGIVNADQAVHAAFQSAQNP